MHRRLFRDAEQNRRAVLLLKRWAIYSWQDNSKPWGMESVIWLIYKTWFSLNAWGFSKKNPMRVPRYKTLWKVMSNFILHTLSISHSLKSSFSHPLSQVFPFLVIPGTQTGSFRAHIPALAFLPGIWTHPIAPASCLQLSSGWGCGSVVAPFHGCRGTL